MDYNLRFIILVVIVTIAVALYFIYQQRPLTQANADHALHKQWTRPVKFSQNVIYFRCAEADFGAALAHYMETQPYMVVVSIAPDDTGFYGSTKGYFVVIGSSEK
jgi:hypothetical protein